MMKKKKYIQEILIFMFVVLLLGLAGCGKKSDTKKEENVLVIEASEEEENLMQGAFETDTPKNETSQAKTLGGSRTLEVIPPKDDTGDENTEENQKGEWIPGIW